MYVCKYDTSYVLVCKKGQKCVNFFSFQQVLLQGLMMSRMCVCPAFNISVDYGQNLEKILCTLAHILQPC